MSIQSSDMEVSSTDLISMALCDEDIKGKHPGSRIDTNTDETSTLQTQTFRQKQIKLGRRALEESNLSKSISS